ncbi:hypothetical protein VNO77_02385 [Canavalia gladiata]|uniref:Uncharacterized protein n=1 Tax=Canavalia gladiata TaxID=3824 RepID=A0AAN9RB84_CANGL
MPSLYHTYTPKTMTRPNAAIGAQQLFWISPGLSTLAPENTTVMAGQGLSIAYNCFRIANKNSLRDWGTSLRGPSNHELVVRLLGKAWSNLPTPNFSRRYTYMNASLF